MATPPQSRSVQAFGAVMWCLEFGWRTCRVRSPMHPREAPLRSRDRGILPESATLGGFLRERPLWSKGNRSSSEPADSGGGGPLRP